MWDPHARVIFNLEHLHGCPSPVAAAPFPRPTVPSPWPAALTPWPTRPPMTTAPISPWSVHAPMAAAPISPWLARPPMTAAPISPWPAHPRMATTPITSGRPAASPWLACLHFPWLVLARGRCGCHGPRGRQPRGCKQVVPEVAECCGRAATAFRGRCPPWTETGLHCRATRQERKFERRKKITGVFWPFRVPIHVGTSKLSATSTKMATLGCHVDKKAIVNEVSNKSGKFVGAIVSSACHS
jgi:hypothetical protein